MRGLFGLVGLLLVAAIVAVLAKNQLRALGASSASRVTTTTQGEVSVPAPQGATVREQAQSMQERAKTGVEQALQQGAQRASDSAP